MVTKVQGLWKAETTGEVIRMTPNQDQSPRSVDSRDYTWSDYNNLNHDESPKSVESRDCEVISTMPYHDQSLGTVESRDCMRSKHQHNAISWPKSRDCGMWDWMWSNHQHNAISWPKSRDCGKQRLYCMWSNHQHNAISWPKSRNCGKQTVCEVINTMPYHDQSPRSVESRDCMWSKHQHNAISWPARSWPKSKVCGKQS